MKKLINLVTAFSISMLLLGCTASGVKYSTLAELDNIKENLIIYRKNMALGSALQPTVYVDGKYLGSLENAGFVKHAVTAGEHTIKVGNKEEKLRVEDNQKHYYKYNVRTSILFFITITPESLSKVDKKTAMKELLETKLSTHRINN